MAAAIKQHLQLDTDIVEGSRGEFSVWVGDRCVAKKDREGFPEDAAIVEAVRQVTNGA